MDNQKQQSWPDRFEERLHIFALGKSFDVDAFLANSTLRPDFVWRRMGNGPSNPTGSSPGFAGEAVAV
jgi:hypothetical protein